jgi:hypothetical protein
VIVVITGGPRTGKSYLGERMALTSGTALLRTDDLIAMGWSEASQDVAARLLVAGAAGRDLIAEGVAVARALRKALGQSRDRPCDRLIVLRSLRPEAGAQTLGQLVMAKGVRTVLREIWGELVARGVEIVDRNGVGLVAERP